MQSVTGSFKPMQLFSNTMLRFLHNNKRIRLDKNSKSGDLVLSGDNDSDGLWRYILSQGNEDSCEILIVNNLDQMLVLCWVDNDGMLHHYHNICDGSINDGSVDNTHTEYTQAYHSFVCIKFSNKKYKNIVDIPDEDFVFLYRPHISGRQHHLTISKIKNSSTSKIKLDVILHEIESVGDVIDTSQKLYEKDTIHGFDILYERGVYHACLEVYNALSIDLGEVVRLYPPTAVAKLQSDTKIWLNTALTYGTTKHPVVATSCTFHPKEGAGWLSSNGLSTAKAGCIEIFSAEAYVRDRHLWGDGGILVHELAHAYHNKHCPDGFDCEDIREAYQAAMMKKLYDAVRVKGSQGRNGPTKAYACANCMEFWAETSVAYMWTDDSDYNKWFPHNRSQLMSHDPDTYRVLVKYWGDTSSTSSIGDDTYPLPDAVKFLINDM